MLRPLGVAEQRPGRLLAFTAEEVRAAMRAVTPAPPNVSAAA